MLVNLSPVNKFRCRSEEHAKYMNRCVREKGKKKYVTLKFSDLFTPTPYTGVYWGYDEDAIKFFCKQTLVYNSKTYWKLMDDMYKNKMIKRYRDYENNAWTFGVADNLEQIITLYKENKDGYFCGNHVILCEKIVKNSNNPCSGWRWHKWGPYIGDYVPQCEYLNDEPEIDEVVVFSIYKVI